MCWRKFVFDALANIAIYALPWESIDVIPFACNNRTMCSYVVSTKPKRSGSFICPFKILFIWVFFFTVTVLSLPAKPKCQCYVLFIYH